MQVSRVATAAVHASPRMPEDPSHVGPLPAPDEATPPPGGQADFADVSHYQSGIDWDKYAASGRSVAICKATEGLTYVDDTEAANRAAMQKEGLYCGLYHFAGSSSSDKIHDPVAEADFFVSQVGPLGPREFPVLDFELAYHMTPAQQVSWIGKWCTEVQKKTGKTPWVYTDTYMLKKMDARSIAGFPLWLANYNLGDDPKHPPASGSWPNLTAWQYTYKADVPGIGPCDDSFLYGDMSVLVGGAASKVGRRPERSGAATSCEAGGKNPGEVGFAAAT